MKLSTVLQVLGAGAILHVVVSACQTSPSSHSNVDAAPSVGADTASEPCVNGYATHAYPGKTAVDLAGIQTLGRLGSPFTVNGKTYTHWQPGVYTFIADGSVTVSCAGGIDQVWLVLP